MSEINKLFTKALGAATLRLFASLFACLFLFCGSSSAQISRNSDGLTPPGLAPGAPAGAYPLSEFEQINLFNGQVNFTFPVAQKGRGGANLSLPIKINRPAWLVQHRLESHPNPYPLGQTYDHVLEPYPDWWNETYARPILPGGRMFGRHVGTEIEDCSTSGNGVIYQRTNTFLTFIAPDGTEYHFIDKRQGGLRRAATCTDFGDGYRGTIWISDDGSGATFVSQPSGIADKIYPDDPYRSDKFNVNGYVMLKDGTRFDISGGQVTRMRDRNGNEVKFEELLQYGTSYSYAVGYKITDSLNREIRIDYNATDAPQYGSHDKITIKGFGGAERIIRVSYTFEGNWLRTTQTNDPTTPWRLEQLFPQLDGYGWPAGSPSVAAIWLPDGKSYKFKYNVYQELARVELPTGGAVEYDYEGGEQGGTMSGEVGDYGIVRWPANVGQVPRVGIYRRLIKRRLYKENNTLVGVTTYSKPNETYIGPGDFQSDLLVEQLDANGTTLLSRTRHYFHGSARESTLGTFDPTGTPFWKDGREFKTETLPLTASNNPLRSVENTWGVGLISSEILPPYYIPFYINAYPRVTQTKTTWHDSNQFAYQVFLYDSVNNQGGYNNQIEVKEYDFGIIPDLLRQL